VKLLKKEKDALTALLEGGAESAGDLAELVAGELDRQRAERSFSYGVLILAGIPKTLGPYATSGQAKRALAKHGADKAWVVGGHTSEGLDLHMAKVDAPPAVKGDFATVAEDALAFSRGWNGKQATRAGYLR
jgi:hypothetical protein